MRSVMFTFRPDVPPDEQEALLKEIGGWQSVSKATRLKADSKHPDIFRMAYAYVKDEADVNEVVRQLARLPGIESPSEQPRRKLV